MPAKKVLAVAIGVATNDCQIVRSSDPNIRNTRPYIGGLIDRLSDGIQPPKQKSKNRYTIGTDYTIDYRERKTDGDLDTLFTNEGRYADLIFCRSTTVVRRADAFAKNTPGQGNKPIVAVVSDPKRENFGSNVCGVSAMRSQTAGECMDEFRGSQISDLTTVYVLHKDQYDPSSDAKFWVQDDPNNVVVSILTVDDIGAKIRGLQAAPAGETYGILVLPADRFFAERDAIFAAANAMKFPTFWSVTDFVGLNKAFGGYGAPQKTSGRYMASQVDKIWANGNAIPKNPRWVAVSKSDFTTRMSLAVAKALEVKLKAKKGTPKKSTKKPRKSKKR